MITSRSVTIANDIGLVDLGFELQMQIIGTLSPSTIATSTDGWIVLIVPARSDSQIVDAFTKRSANS